MSKISDGINQESKERMLNVLTNKKEQVQIIKESMKETAQKLTDELDTLSSFWINALLKKIGDYNRDLLKLEAEIGLLELYTGTTEPTQF